MSNKTNIFKDIAIPEQLKQNSDIRYIIIKKDDIRKHPLESRWQIDNNYSSSDPKLRGMMRGGFNYGVATGFGGLIVVDIDNMNRANDLGLFEKLPQTFTVKTGGGGKHFYYFCNGIKKTTMFDPILKDSETGFNLHIGEIQSMGQFVIGPSSVHRNGNRYEIIDDGEIRHITKEELEHVIEGLQTRKKTPKKCNKERTIRDDVDIENITTPKNAQVRQGSNGREIIGENPWHGATKKEDRGVSKNFSMNPGKGIWHCFACGSGGGWMEMLAVDEGMIRCDQAGEGCLTGKQRRELIEIAESRGLIKPHIPAESKDIDIIDSRTELESLPKTIPEHRITVIRKPPRVGGTHWAIKMMNRHSDGNYITHRHSIVEHAVRVAEELNMRSVVWLVGMNQPGACRRETVDCDHCPLKPSQSEYLKQQEIARKLMREVGVLTTNKVPENMCPYYTMRMAEPSARYCMTVSNNIDTIVPRKMVVLDEDPTLQTFYPPSIELATIRKTRGDQRIKNGLVQLDNDLTDIIENKKRKKLLPYAMIIKSMSDIIEQFGQEGADEVGKRLDLLLSNWIPTSVHVREEGEMEGDISLEACVRCLSNLYDECPVSVQSDGRGGDKIFLLGDERTPVFSMDWMEKADKVIIIGATKAEMFAKEFGGHVMEITKFGYKDRYTVLLLNEQGRGSRNKEKKDLLRIASTMWKDAETDSRMPFMILTGSQRSQQSVVGSIGGSIGVKSEKETGLKWGFSVGAPVVFYQNSVISRGLDVDQYNLMIIYDCNFAQPFWSVADPTIRDMIVSDETTNSALRMSPTLRRDNGNMKVIVMREKDFWKVKYLEGREKYITSDVTAIGRALKKMWVGGKVNIDEKGISIIGTGIKESRGTRLLEEVLENPEDYPDEVDIKMTKNMILKHMRKQKRARHLVCTTSEITEAIQKRWVINRRVVAAAVRDLYGAGIIKLVKTGKNGTSYWRI